MNVSYSKAMVFEGVRRKVIDFMKPYRVRARNVEKSKIMLGEVKMVNVMEF